MGCEGVAGFDDGFAACAGAGVSAFATGLAAGLAADFGAASAFFVAALDFGAAFLAAFFLSLAFTGDGRDFRPRRWALPMTALRLTPPSSSAIWLAVEPPSHIFLSVAMRSSVQLIQSLPNLLSGAPLDQALAPCLSYLARLGGLP